MISFGTRIVGRLGLLTFAVTRLAHHLVRPYLLLVLEQKPLSSSRKVRMYVCRVMGFNVAGTIYWECVSADRDVRVGWERGGDLG